MADSNLSSPSNNQSPQGSVPPKPVVNNPLDEPLPSPVSNSVSANPAPSANFNPAPTPAAPLPQPLGSESTLPQINPSMPPTEPTNLNADKPIPPPPPPVPATPPPPPRNVFELPSEEEIAQAQKTISATPPPPPSPPQTPPPPTLIKKTPPPPPPIAPQIKKPKSGLGKVLLVFIIILLILAGIAVGLTYAGIYEVPYVSEFLGISNKTFKNKIEKAKNVAAKNQDYNFTALIKIGQSQEAVEGNSSIETETPPEFPDLNAPTSTQATTNNLNIRIAGNRKNDSMSGVINISPQDSNATVFDLAFDFAMNEKNLYLRPKGLYLEENNQWQALALEGLNKSNFSIFLKMADVDSILNDFQDGTWLSEEKVNIKNQDNEEVATIESNKYQITSLNLGTLKIENFSTYLNLAKKGDHPIKIASSGTINQSTPLEVEYYYYNYDKDQVVEIPEENQSQATTLEAILTNYGFYGVGDNNSNQEEKETRDNKRKTDLESLANALEEYKKNNGRYPITIQIEKTNSSSVLKEALVSDYLSSLPVDPLDPQYWYGYNSDGYSYRLTSVIEGSKLSAIQGDNVKYQEIVK